MSALPIPGRMSVGCLGEEGGPLPASWESLWQGLVGQRLSLGPIGTASPRRAVPPAAGRGQAGPGAVAAGEQKNVPEAPQTVVEGQRSISPHLTGAGGVLFGGRTVSSSQRIHSTSLGPNPFQPERRSDPRKVLAFCRAWTLQHGEAREAAQPWSSAPGPGSGRRQSLSRRLCLPCRDREGLYRADAWRCPGAVVPAHCWPPSSSPVRAHMCVSQHEIGFTYLSDEW